MGCRGAGGPPARRMKSGKQAKMPMFSVISRHSGECGILPRLGGWRVGGTRKGGGETGGTDVPVHPKREERWALVGGRADGWCFSFSGGMVLDRVEQDSGRMGAQVSHRRDAFHGETINPDLTEQQTN